MDTWNHLWILWRGLIETEVEYQRHGELRKDRQTRFAMRLAVAPERESESDPTVWVENTVPTNICEKPQEEINIPFKLKQHPLH